jgi:Uma2 family endonuclease
MGRPVCPSHPDPPALREPWQANFPPLTVDLLVNGLRQTAAAELRMRREMSVILGRRQRPELDLIVVRAETDIGAEQTAYQSSDVVLAVEVVSPDSEERDRERKPQL